MPVSAAERQKRTASGQVARRRLLHVAGARAVLSAALAAALPPPGEARPVALYGYVEVPPILPGDGNIAAYTSLWSTGSWLGLLTGMGFTVGSTPVRRWKTDLGLYGAKGKDASLALARALFPGQQPILRHKKNHGRADALLIAAWALGACLPRGLGASLRRNGITLDQLLLEQPGTTVGLVWGPPRPPAPTDAYGNLLTPEQDMWDEIEAAETKVERKAQARSSTARRRKTAGTQEEPAAQAEVEQAEPGTGVVAAAAGAAAPKGRRAKKAAVESGSEAAVAEVAVGPQEEGGEGEVAGQGGRACRSKSRSKSSGKSSSKAEAGGAGSGRRRAASVGSSSVGSSSGGGGGGGGGAKAPGASRRRGGAKAGCDGGVSGSESE